ncbi:MAG: tRNA (cytosine(32)/uridine(32)-2'-O)-methyltransferase TrmJ [Pseudomonadales bacterium]|nr:tRNA (cytosine(32)/uridine(32)-2'-O)-methyltransferase TrmJ [Pseudomonadales bacterium]MCP5215834.1 tRNA (cytosine(32)/uridine(32)-2'-O)-methyltransferase TrmJ [Pseudomonadales bacterium]
MLNRIRVVLVNTSHPGNIGAAARAIKNMGLSRLYLVAPKQFPDEKATWRAASALDILDQAVICETLDEAISGCHLVVGASARDRSIPWPVMEARQAAETIINEPESHEVAVLFGREDRGLTNDELQRCHFHLQIPSNPDYSSLNLGAAVQVVSYELRVAAIAESGLKQAWDWGIEWDIEAASTEEIQRFFEHLEETLIGLKVINPKNPRQLMTRLKRLYIRSRPDQVEVNLLRGILTATQKLLPKL